MTIAAAGQAQGGQMPTGTMPILIATGSLFEPNFALGLARFAFDPPRMRANPVGMSLPAGGWER